MARKSEMEKYLYTLLSEKGYDVDEPIIVGKDPFYGDQWIVLDEIVRFILKADKATQQDIRRKLVYIDFKNGDVLDLFKYIGRFMFAHA